MASFYIQNQDGSLAAVGHDEFYDKLNSGSGYLHYGQGGQHIALLPTADNAETVQLSEQGDKQEDKQV